MTEVHSIIQLAPQNVVSRKSTLLLLVLVTIVTIWFGVRPFNFTSRNRVYWLKNQNGVQFHEQGSFLTRSSPGVIYSPKNFEVSSVAGTYEPITIELYVEPDDEAFDYVAHILAFGDGERIESFVIGQWKTDLEIIRQGQEGRSGQDYRNIYLKSVLHRDVKTFVTITSDQARTDVYLNGQLARTYSKESLIGVEQFHGHLMLGNASDCGNQWAGKLYGFGLYRGALSPEQVYKNYEAWTCKEVRPLELVGRPIALYTFDERQGSQVFNYVGGKNHLLIPETYSPLKRNLLVPFWKGTIVDRGLFFDVIINVLGFVPFAFWLTHCLSVVGRIPQRFWTVTVVLSGAIMSLAIEISQAYLPTRHSSLLDLICNTCGACLGVSLYTIVCGRLSALKPRVYSSRW